MEIILIDDVFELGKRGEVVEVADGYGRNYLIPKRLAIPATPGNRKMIEQQRLAMAKKEATYKEEAELLAQELNQLHLIISRKSGETGNLFGSVTTKDITDLLVQSGIHLDRRKILLGQPIKSIGNYQIQVHPHSAVAVELLLSVLVEGDGPVNRVKKKDEESEAIISELEARIQEIEQLAGTRSAAAEEPEIQEETTPQEAPAAEGHEESTAEEQTQTVEKQESPPEEEKQEE